MHTLVAPEYFVEPNQLFPRWPEWRPEWAIEPGRRRRRLLLFLPKILSVLLVAAARARTLWRRGRGWWRASRRRSLASALLAPIRMLFHTRFVVAALAGWSVQWKSPPREDAETTWGEAVRRHGAAHARSASRGRPRVYWLNPAFLWWLLPVVGALIAVDSDLGADEPRVARASAARRARLFLIPEETDPPPEIRATLQHLRNTPAPPTFADAVVDPALNALVAALAIPRSALPIVRARAAAYTGRARIERRIRGAVGAREIGAAERSARAIATALPRMDAAARPCAMAGAARGIASVERAGEVRFAEFGAFAGQNRVGRYQWK